MRRMRDWCLSRAAPACRRGKRRASVEGAVSRARGGLSRARGMLHSEDVRCRFFGVVERRRLYIVESCLAHTPFCVFVQCMPGWYSRGVGIETSSESQLSTSAPNPSYISITKIYLPITPTTLPTASTSRDPGKKPTIATLS